MRLNVEDKVTKENPGMEEIATALASLDGEKAGFAILECDALTYVQASGSTRTGFSLEYQDGSLEEHYCCTTDLPIEEAIKVFQSYARGEKQWRLDHNWELMKITSNTGAIGVVILIVTTCLFVSAVLATSAQHRAVSFVAAGVGAALAVVWFMKRKK